MTEPTNNTKGENTPPSFMPSGTRKKRVSKPSSAEHASQDQRSSPVAQGIPSFVPTTPRRNNSRGISSQSQSAAGQPQPYAVSQAAFPPSSKPRRTSASHNTPQISPQSKPLSDSPSVNHSPDMPDMIEPKRYRRESSSTGSSSAGSSTPIQAQPRSTQGSSRNASAMAHSTSFDSRAKGSHGNSHGGNRNINTGIDNLPGGSGRNTAVKPKRHRLMKVLIAAFLAILLALLITVFGTWNWVDGKLNKSAWLTDKADTAGTSWLILGSDERDGSQGGDDNATDTPGFRTDTILVLTKPKKGPSALISIPRDSLVQEQNEYMKINAIAQLYSEKTLVSKVETITGQKIDHVAQVKFGGLKNVVDALGGVQLCYDQTVNDPYSGLNWQAGCHIADGGTALAFSRMRYADANGDFGRTQRQREVIGAIVTKASSAQVLTNIPKLIKVGNAALDSVSVDNQTNPYTLLMMALAFRSASAPGGITGTLYWSDPDYYVDGVGSCVLLDDAKNLTLFEQLSSGTHASGSVGTLAETQAQ